MTSASRRIFLYWLLLIVSTLVVGGAAFWLLYREQVHIREQAAATALAREAAVQARTRLIAENIGVIMTDVESGLMTTLTAAPANNPDAYLANWERTNPLVHDVFVATPTGQIRWGTPNAPVVAWLVTTPWRASVVQPSNLALSNVINDGDASESTIVPETQVRAEELSPPVKAATPSVYFDSTLNANASQADAREDRVSKDESSAAPPPAASVAQAPISAEIQEQSKISDNVSQYQSARLSLQAAAQFNANMVSRNQQAEVQPVLKEARLQESNVDKKTVSGIAAPSTANQRARASGEQREKTSTSRSRKDRRMADDSNAQASVITELTVATPSPPSGVDVVPFIPDITGWTPWTDAGGVLHLFGWRLTPRGNVLVVEVNLATIASRLREVLPANVEPDEAYLLVQDKNVVIGQTGFERSMSASSGKSFVQALTLPGWSITGLTLTDDLGTLHTQAFTWVSALLIGIFILAILGGGSLLMRQARLSEAESAQKTSFVSNVSHEFKTPLTTIRLYAELLEQGRIRDDAKRVDSLHTISRETQRLARLVNNVLDFSRLEQGRKKFDIADYDLREEISRILDRHAPRLADAGMKLDLVRGVAPCVVKTDLDAVEQIVINLLDNACKYAASGGEIAVTLENTAGGARIVVADRGPGIPPAHREKIFEKFHRVDETLTASQGGAGLGLSIARQLARGLGGDLTYSPRKGGGSEFILTLLKTAA